MPSLLENLTIRVPDAQQPVPTEVKVDEPKVEKPEEKETEVKPSEVKPPVKVETKPEVKLSPTRTDFQKLEDAKKAAEQRVQEREKEIEESKKRISELDAALKDIEPYKKNATEIQSLLQKREEELALLRQELKSASIERDPEFQEKFIKGKQQQIDHLKDMLSSEVQPEFQRAIRTGNEDSLNELRDSLQPHQQRKWDAHLLRIEQLEIEKRDEIENADRTWQKQQEHKKQQYVASSEQVLNTHRQLGKKVITDIRGKIGPLSEDPKLMSILEEMAEAVAGGTGSENWDTARLMENVLMTPVLAEHAARMNSLFEGALQKQEATDKELSEYKEKVTARDEFIKKITGRAFGEDTFAGGKDVQDIDPNKSLLRQLVIKRS